MLHIPNPVGTVDVYPDLHAAAEGLRRQRDDALALLALEKENSSRDKAFWLEIDVLTTERDAFRITLAETRAEIDALRAELARVTAERDALIEKELDRLCAQTRINGGCTLVMGMTAGCPTCPRRIAKEKPATVERATDDGGRGLAGNE